MLLVSAHRNKEDGYIIIAALLILALLTIICVSAANMSKTEINIATNELLYERAFYAAESGLQHLTELLRSQYVDGNAAILSSGGTSNWSFALQGAADSDGVVINTNLDNINLQVRIWNNNDGGGPANDTDGLIYVRSEARGARGALCRIEMLLEGNMNGTAVSDYIAQEGAGPGKNFVSDDAVAMEKENFSQTDLNVE